MQKEKKIINILQKQLVEVINEAILYAQGIAEK